ncbi:MAG: hypothetical protein N2Z80_05350 [Hydrogenothermaceae bacterium]|nr:hypothetical protein [Hydrogenothermaceae bacterium]
MDEKTGELLQREDIPTPLPIVEAIDSCEENAFWVNLKNLWVLIGKAPPLSLEMDDIIIFRERGKWGLFRLVERKDGYIILTDGQRKKKTKVRLEDFSQLNLLGKVIRVQQKL